MYTTTTKNASNPDQENDNSTQQNRPAKSDEPSEVVPSTTIENAKNFGKPAGLHIKPSYMDIEKGYVPISTMLSNYEKNIETKEIEKRQKDELKEIHGHSKENKTPVKKVVAKIKKVVGGANTSDKHEKETENENARTETKDEATQTKNSLSDDKPNAEDEESPEKIRDFVNHREEQKKIFNKRKSIE